MANKQYVREDYDSNEYKAFVAMVKEEPRCKFWAWWDFMCAYVDVFNLSYNQGTTGYDKRGYNKDGYRFRKVDGTPPKKERKEVKTNG